MVASRRRVLTRVSGSGLSWLVDERAAAVGVAVSFHDRRGGRSRPPFDTLNLALSTGDDRDDVAANRGAVARAAGWSVESLALAKQIHAADVIEVSAGSPAPVGHADILATNVPGVVLGILSADCVPVALRGRRGVAMVHAGWRGLVAGAIEAGIAAIGPVDAAWVGPSIHACCYEVSDDVIDAFRGAGLPVAGERRVDPGRAASFALRRAGVDDIAATEECTSCDPRYFSYRRDGVTGRQGSFVSLLPAAP
jgi:YfiH family protein